MDDRDLWTATAAEFVGPFTLVVAGVGAIISTQNLSDGGNLVAVSLAHGLAIGLMVAALGHISGGHFNPAVTLVFATRGTTPWNEVAPYVIVQCLGGIAGTILAHLMFDLAPLMIGTKVRSGPSQWLGEAVATFTLVLTILGGLRYSPQACSS